MVVGLKKGVRRELHAERCTGIEDYQVFLETESDGSGTPISIPMFSATFACFGHFDEDETETRVKIKGMHDPSGDLIETFTIEAID